MVEFNISSGRAPDGNIPIFFSEIRQNDAETEKRGFPVMEEVHYVKIVSPGNKNEVPVFRVSEKHKKLYKEQWEAYINKTEFIEEGSPLSEWPQCTRLQAATLASIGVHTVEKLAAIPDENLTRIGQGLLPLKHRAITHLDHISGEVDIQKLASENRKLEKRNRELEKQLMELAARLDILEKMSKEN